MTFVPVGASASAALAGLPAGVDAAFLGPMGQLDDAALDSLLMGFRQRRIPTFAYNSRAEVERGALAAYAPKDDLVRRARRVADALQRIVGDDPAAELAVDLASIPRLTLNLETARAIGFSPTWTTLAEAEVIHGETRASGPTWSLPAVAAEAVRANLSLRSAERAAAAGRQDVAIARGALLPQAQAQLTGTMVREGTARASFGQKAERETNGQLVVSLPLMSETKWASLSVERHRQTAREADRRTAELDAVHDATSAYLDVLRAKALAEVERENLKNTRTHLEQARLKERTGASSRADVFRWEAEVASDRRSVLSAEARQSVAALEFNRQLDRPLEESFETQEASTLDPGQIIGDPRVLDYFATPESFRVFRDFLESEGRGAAPELVAAEAGVAAAERSATAARRSLWLPTLSLDGSWSNVYSRDGAGSTTIVSPLSSLPQAPDATWSVRLQGSLPVFDGFIRNAQIGQANLEVQRMALERRNADQAVAARIRAALQQAEASWFGIEQARLAARASHSNLQLVSDAYVRGTASITALIDAKQAAFSADQSAANAVYDFLGNLMDVERAIGRFEFFRSAEEREALFRRMDDFYRKAGVAPRSR
jgi:outer membrane protein TolC